MHPKNYVIDSTPINWYLPEYDPKEKPIYCVIDGFEYFKDHYTRPTLVVITFRPFERISSKFQELAILKTKSYYEAINSPVLDIWKVMNEHDG